MKMKRLSWSNMNYNKLQGFSTIEILMALFITALLGFYTLNFYKEIALKNTNILNEEQLKIDLVATQLFLEKNKNLSLIEYNNKTLYYNKHHLLEKVTSFEQKNHQNFEQINLCLEDILCQEWVFLK